MHGAIDIWRLNMTRKRGSKAQKKNSMDLPKACCSNLILNEKFLYINHLCRFYTFLLSLCVSQALVSLYPPLPSPKKNKEKGKRGNGCQVSSTHFQLGWEKDRPKYLGFEFCRSSSKARPFAPKLSSKARLLPQN